MPFSFVSKSKELEVKEGMSLPHLCAEIERTRGRGEHWHVLICAEIKGIGGGGDTFLLIHAEIGGGGGVLLLCVKIEGANLWMPVRSEKKN